ncbi:hypothetical protein K1T71_004604 [Dendrolimus kikuchii]|uniref:Uncharacterized protein n=1 Tax=Dendrolimus kikuchii TaxID=765133 RepID=A0ACC1D8V0_9NEOP|nr:hypothetical protein K1T71_004604 [Dendrolimus kikuchii]
MGSSIRPDHIEPGIGPDLHARAGWIGHHLSFATHAAARRVVEWRVLEEVKSLSDHRYIRFELTPSSGPSPVHRPPLLPSWALTKLDPERAEEWALTESWAYPAEFANLESQAEHMCKTLTRVCDAAMPRVPKRQPPCKQVHWWTEELGEMRKAVRIISHRLKRCRARRPPDYVAENGLVGEFREARKALSIAILQAKARARAELLDRDARSGPLGASVPWDPQHVAALHIHGRFPSQWKEGRLCLIPKGGRPPNDPFAFRLIVLLNEVAKVFEKILAERLVKHLDAVEPGLSETQFGFRRRRSTMDAFETL